VGASDLFDLHGRVALVTGAGQNVGARIAELLAEQGAAVAVNDLDASRADAVVQQIRAAGGVASSAIGDVTDGAQVAAVVAEVGDELGPVDVLVNNAGLPVEGLPTGPFADLDPSDWEATVQLNLHAVLRCTRAVLPSMIERSWGRVVTIVSDAGRSGEPQLAVYSAAKAGAIGFTRAIAKEVGRHGVTCNAVALGSIRRTEATGEADVRRARHYPMRRLGRPDDVAPAVLYFVSPAAGWVTGQTLGVDGGYVMA
jgi:3-oxoacyl-[acyl-carrier protein] reductase